MVTAIELRQVTENSINYITKDIREQIDSKLYTAANSGQWLVDVEIPANMVSAVAFYYTNKGFYCTYIVYSPEPVIRIKW